MGEFEGIDGTGDNGDNRETAIALALFSPSTLFPPFAKDDHASFVCPGIWIEPRRDRCCR
jgi:hypothetical protein